MTRFALGSAILVLGLAGCGGGRSRATLGPVANAASSTVTAVDSLYREAETSFRHGKWGKAQELIERVSPSVLPGDARYLRLHFMLGEVFFAEGNQLQAVREFRRVADEQPDGPLAADALLRAGDAYADLWRRPELDPTYGQTAIITYEEVGRRYAGTPEAARAASRLARLNEMFAEKEYKNGLFYFRFKAYESAILMFRGLIATYPQSKVVPDALDRLVRSYQILGYQEDIKETCAYIEQYHPQASGPRRRCPRTADTTAARPSSGPGR